MGDLFSKLASQNMEIVLVGIENSGKTTLLNQFRFPEDDPSPTAPTLGASYRTVKSKGLQMKMWDLGGQKQFRSEWPKYTAGANVIIFMVDSSNPDAFPSVKKELHSLLDEKSLNGVPILILGNKADVKPHAEEEEIIKGLNLDYIKDNEWKVIMVSALMGRGIKPVIEWLIETQQKRKK